MTVEFLPYYYPIFLKGMSARLEESFSKGGKFLVGDKFTTADFLFTFIIFTLIFNDQAIEMVSGLKAPFEQYPALLKYAENAKAENASYLETRIQGER